MFYCQCQCITDTPMAVFHSGLFYAEPTHAAVPNLRLGCWQGKVQVKGKWRRYSKLWIRSRQYVRVKGAIETHVITFYQPEKAGQCQNSVVHLCHPTASATKQPHVMHGKDESHH